MCAIVAFIRAVFDEPVLAAEANGMRTYTCVLRCVGKGWRPQSTVLRTSGLEQVILASPSPFRS